MAVVLPLLAFALAFGAWLWRERDWREAWLVAATVSGATITLLTEALSLFHAVAPIPLTVAWAAVCALAGGWLAWERQRARITSVATATSAQPAAVGARDWLLRTIVSLLGLLLAVLGFIAVTAAPNTVDALTYHLPRVMHWLQNGDVGHYPTAILRQVYLGPWSGYALLQLQALLGSDQLTGIVQWFSLVSAVIGCSLIARRLGADALGQAVAATVAGTAPMVVLQAPSAQNDLVVGWWLVAATVFLLATLDPAGSRSRCFWFVGLAGVALGHAILTKATAYFFGLPLMVWLAVALGRRWRAQALPLVGLFAALAIAPNLPNYARQARTFGSPLGPGKEAADHTLPAAPYGNDLHTPAAVASNLLRNLALELATPWSAATGAVERTVITMHRWLGLAPNDPRTTWPDMPFRVFSEGWRDESFAGNPLHLLLILAAFAVVAVRAPRSPAAALAFSVVAGFVVFSGMLRWNLWISRLLTPLFLLAAPIVSFTLQRSGRRWLAAGVAFVTIALAVPVALWSTARPLAGAAAYWRYDRQQQYYFFNNGASVQQIHQQIVDAAARYPCNAVGLRMGRDEVEYPLWVAFRAKGLRPRIEHEAVANETGRYYARLPRFEPDLSITVRIGERQVSIEAHRPPLR